MAAEMIVETPRGPSYPGRRITVYDLIPYLLTDDYTEAMVARMFQLTDVQVAAGRAYIFAHADTVLAEHLKIEERLNTPNPPEVIEHAKGMKERLAKYQAWHKEYMTERETWAKDAGPVSMEDDPPIGVNFTEWVKARIVVGKAERAASQLAGDPAAGR